MNFTSSTIKSSSDSESQRNKHHSHVQQFKIAMERMTKNNSSDDYQVIIRADKVLAGEHDRRYNTPTVEKVAILIVGDPSEPRDIELQKRSNDEMIYIRDTNRSYDCLQYPITHCRGEDGYPFILKHINPETNHHVAKKISAMEF